MKQKAKRLKPGTTEKQVAQQVVEAAAMFGVKLERRNTGAGVNPSGKLIRFGTPGDSDYYGILPIDRFKGKGGGRAIAIEVKHQNFDPRKLRGKARAHFARQLAHMERVNREGGLATWLDSGEQFIHFMRRVMEWKTIRVEFDCHGFPWITDEPEGTP